MINVAITGAAGRMGSGIIKKVLEQENMNLVAAIEIPNTPLENKDVGEVVGIGNVGVNIKGAENLEKVLKDSKANVLVDFTIANAAFETIKKTAKLGINLIVGTTGFSDEQTREIHNIIKESNIKAVISSNMSIGVNVFFKILKDVSPLLSDYDIEIVEAHHNKKKDSPSGTAMTAFKIISKELNRNTEDIGVFGRKGNLEERTKNEIGLHAIRGGDIVGTHDVIFAGEGEHIEIKHVAHSRDVFISGVIKSLNFIENGTPGKVNSMNDVLGI
ncbi:MAG: 4-hydroxy-tetrahydrodipicolinate reductase [Methanobrevibacter sp.]|jgi:4-hydroxy-tetrahydrodipicolinate reductase|nr:4-hydroxy-tetrahydrodipicolinate reductase [Candidatus Methanovirga aequatorialis]